MRLFFFYFSVAAAMAVVVPSIAEDNWGTVATISGTMGVQANRLCLGEASRGDLGCPTYAPFVAANGWLGLGTTSPTSHLDLGSGTNGRGISWGGTSGNQNYAHIFTEYSSGALHLAKGYMGGNGAGLGILSSQDTVVGRTGLVLRNSASAGNSYISFYADAPISAPAGTAISLTERMRITEEGLVAIGTATPRTSLDVAGTIRIASGGETCDAHRAGAISYVSATFYFCNGAGGWRSLAAVAAADVTQPDRIVSGTTSVVANSSGYISLTTSNQNTGYFDTAGRLVIPGISVTTNQSSFTLISANRLNVGTAPGTIDRAIASYISRTDEPAYGVYSDVNTTMTANATMYSHAYYTGNTPNILSGVTNSGYVMGGRTSVLRRVATDAGTLAQLIGFDLMYGHYTPAAAGRTTDNVYGLKFAPLAMNGEIGTLYDIYIGSPSAGGTIGRHFGIYQNATSAINYFGARTAIGAVAGQMPSTTLQVAGSIRLGVETSSTLNTCDVNRAGAMRYASGSFDFCDGVNGWRSLAAVAAAGALPPDRLVSGSSVATLSPAGIFSVQGRIDLVTGTNVVAVSTSGILAAGGVSTTGNATISGSIKISGLAAEVCGPGKYGTMKIVNGRLWMCREN